MAVQSSALLCAEPALAAIFGSRFQNRHKAFQKNAVMDRRAGAAATDDGAGNMTGENRGPVIRLLRPHRPTIDGVQPLDPLKLGKHAPLRLDIIKGCHDTRPSGCVRWA
jgi:hypothetical protein